MSKTFKRVLLTLTMAVASLVTTGTVQAQDFKVIVNSANATASLSASDASKIFLKESTKFPGGSSATPVDQGKASPIRAAFSKAVIGRSVGAVETYWQQQIFSGKEVPPATRSSDDDIVAFVKANPSAIGYVSASVSTVGVKVVDVK